MNTLVKASVVGAAGVSLLMGGFGTYALWHDDAAGDTGSVTSGVLDVTAGTATWSDISATGPTNWTLGSPIVPGDKIRMTQSFDVTATGKNMKGTLTFAPGTTTIPAGWSSYLTITPAATADVAFTSSGTNAWTFNAPLSGTKTVTATVTYDFASNTPNQVAQALTASIGSSTFSIDQVRP